MKIHGKKGSGHSGGPSPARYDEIRRWLRSRELGHKTTLGHNNRLSRQLYSSVETTRTWDPMETASHQHHGGIFNFDFSKDGSVLVAACEKRSMLMFDPLNGRLIGSKDEAHTDCVNCVRFLDSRLFATCSDDTTVSLWDVRYMKHKIRTLTAHTNWVKNIEFDASSGLLVTSGFDGSIFTWDINRYSESDESFKKVFHTPGLMRMKLTPDASKLVVATGSGYLMVIHNLDLTTLSQDLADFLPNIYRLMQQTNSPIPQAYEQNHVFSQARNRVELISDFPAANKADMIASLEVHPHGWCVVSRNTSSYEASEWTCVHDIQPHEVMDDVTAAYGMSQNPGDDQDLPRQNYQLPQYSEPNATTEPTYSTTPSRTGSPTFLLSISINEQTGSPPSISQTYSTASEDQERAGSPGMPVAHVLGTEPVEFDIPLSIGRLDSVSEVDLEDAVQRRQVMLQGVNTSSSYTVAGGVLNPANRQSSSNHGISGSSMSNMQSLSQANTSSALSSSNSSVYLAQSGQRHPSAVDVLPSLHVQQGVGATNSTFQARWDNPNDSAFITTPTTSTTTTSSSNIMSPSNDTASRMPNIIEHYRSLSNIIVTSTESQSVTSQSVSSSQVTHNPTSITAGLWLRDSVPVLLRSNRPSRVLLFGQPTNVKSRNVQSQPYIHLNRRRLTHYVEELNVGRGFIKEVAFSGDGRLICSPFGFGVRLLSFEQNCSEMCDAIHNSPVKLHEVASTTGHQRSVVTTKFSPLHCMFVSGCLAGKINFNQPRL